jgi:hypothetical protein
MKKIQELPKNHIFAENALPLPPHLNKVLNIIENEKQNKYLWKRNN